MNFIDAIFLFAVMATLAAIPSTSVALVLTRSATLGLANGIAVATGIVIGDLIFVLLALLGLSVVAETLGDLFSGIKYLGGVYLIGMGISLLRSRNRTTVTVEQRKLGTLSTSLLSGLFLTLGDIKAIVFYISLFPVFIDTRSLGPSDTGMIVFITLAAVGGIKTAYAIAARRLAVLPRSLAHEKGIRTFAGCFMIGAGSVMIART
ncbi:MAG TPA: LysE family translocator [Gammaproteobacteria bacterium]|nr:LysE family translocator [Gammaproteobacteria bacterium]